MPPFSHGDQIGHRGNCFRLVRNCDIVYANNIHKNYYVVNRKNIMIFMFVNYSQIWRCYFGKIREC